MVLLFACFPAGALGLMFSQQVGAKAQFGDLAGARTASRAALVTDIVGTVLSVVIVIAVVLTSPASK